MEKPISFGAPGMLAKIHKRPCRERQHSKRTGMTKTEYYNKCL